MPALVAAVKNINTAMANKGTIVVTGGTGFIGSHTVVELQQEGYHVVIIDNLSNSKAEVVDQISKITGLKPVLEVVDVTDYDTLSKACGRYHNIKGIIHFAALKAVGESVEYPLNYYRSNVLGLVNVLEVMKVQEIPHIIFSSSATVYGQPEFLPANENSPIQAPWSPYGATKQMGEQILKDFINANKRASGISLRYFNPVGAHPSALIGELPLGVPGNLMPFITQTAAGIREQLKVFGGDYPTPDGTAIRDYIHVVDVAKAHVDALTKLMQDAHTESRYDVFNIGTGKGYSVLEVIQSFEKMSGLKLNYEIVDRRPGDVESVYASTDKALHGMSWQAQYTLDDMTETAWKWQLKLEH